MRPAGSSAGPSGSRRCALWGASARCWHLVGKVGALLPGGHLGIPAAAAWPPGGLGWTK